MNTQATTATVDLSITGMSCNACAMSIEKGLNAVSGVTATVNFATETARVDYDPGTASAEQLIGVVAGLRAFTAPAVVAWAAFLQWINLSGTWASWMGHGVTVAVLTMLALVQASRSFVADAARMQAGMDADAADMALAPVAK